jgi:hypothetical protein
MYHFSPSWWRYITSCISLLFATCSPIIFERKDGTAPPSPYWKYDAFLLTLLPQLCVMMLPPHSEPSYP